LILSDYLEEIKYIDTVVLLINIYQLLKRKYELNKYILILKIRIWIKTSDYFL